jgi:hypothetical protein
LRFPLQRCDLKSCCRWGWAAAVGWACLTKPGSSGARLGEAAAAVA